MPALRRGDRGEQADGWRGFLVCGVQMMTVVIRLPTFEAPFDIGETVRVDGKTGIEGRVTGYALYAATCEIRVEWFANGDAKSAWFPDWRVSQIQA